MSYFRYAPKRKFIYAPKKSPTFPAKLTHVTLYDMQITYIEFKKYRTIHVESTDIYIYVYIYTPRKKLWLSLKKFSRNS